MADRELERLKRTELLELLIEQTERAEKLSAELNEARKALRNREIRIEQAGSIAEAALQINGVFEAAQEAANQYLENIETLSGRQEAICAKRDEESLREAEQIISDARAEKEKIENECTQMEERTREQCEELAERTRKQCEELILQTKLQCEERQKEANIQVEAKWKELSEKLEEFYKAHEDLRHMLESVQPEGTAADI